MRGMRHVDLSPSTQLLLVGLLSVALAAILMRAAVFIRCEYAGIRPLYPSAWSAAQCRVLECFRLLVGISLIPLWEFFLFIAPSMPTNSPFGYLEMISLIVLVLFSHAWVLLTAPRNLEQAQRLLTIVLAYDFVSSDFPGIDFRGYRVDTRKCFCITAPPDVAS